MEEEIHHALKVLYEKYSSSVTPSLPPAPFTQVMEKALRDWQESFEKEKAKKINRVYLDGCYGNT